ncbi:MAG: hypothetical protein A2Z78_01515 [Candidatus Nealsonbacteria bacterium RBG_13_36_15]|uniref:Response regulatory domain-containing protein n=1 Tax=Candidatus Nealsonbacteria bacterium RBG_13_36_15 TaxID=1801660 RepID=A0A1G2DWG5_9BACT|nr:MAG: hypothetical protein A2Z78_01515 [Candidatus Nealsonbacteria bacterium RBG_13_36_15]
MKKILFIEDESALQKTLGEILQQEGYQIISALDGKIGLESANDQKPDLILLDLILPKLHGLEVLKKLMDNPKTKKIPVIVLTNLEDAEGVEKALELGATTYLVKENYSLDEVVDKVKKTLGE